MKKIVSQFVLIITLVTLITLALPTAAFAQAGEPAEAGGMEVLLAQWVGLTGFAGLIALLINVLKSVGVVKEGQAGNWSTGLNLLGLIGLYALRFYRPEIDPGAIDIQVKTFVDFGMVVFSFILQLISAKGMHALVRGAPVIGKSYSLERAEALRTPLVG